MKKFLLLFFLLPQIIHSQNLSWEVNVSKGIGTFIPHTTKIRHLVSGYETPIAISLLDRSKHTQVFLHYFPSQNPVIGSQWALTPTHDYPIINTSKFQWNWLGGAGIARIENPFHQVSNPKNIAIGSKWNVSILTGFQTKFQMNEWNIGTELFAQHASNGSLKKPNLGMNYLNFYFVVGKSLPNPPKFPIKAPTTSFPPSAWYSTLCAFVNQANLPGAPTSLVLSSQTGWIQMISKKKFFTTGMDIFLDGSNRKTLSKILEKELTPVQTAQIGLQLGYGFWGNNRLAAFVQQGFYLYSLENLEGKLYQRIGIRRKINDQLQFTASLKTHFAQADHLEFGIIYLWKS
jgi:hypothetical protein